MQRRTFSREYKLQAVRLVRERGVSVAQASPSHGQMKPEQLEIERLRREVAKLEAEREVSLATVVLPAEAEAQ